MEAPAIPANEKQRLKTLRSLNVLDTPSEERFNRLTRLAQHMFNVPVSLVSLIDENRLWMKSKVGTQLSETPRDVSFCGHAILSHEILVVTDTTKDRRFVSNPAVVNPPHIRFYAGAPLRHMDGSILGTLCILDTKTRELSAADLQALKDLAELAEHELMAVQLATQDELTAIVNRRGFINQSAQSLELCARQNITSSLVFIDLDDFKSINDKFGHAEGDKALIAFSNVLKESLRDSDIVGRLSGDEFAVLLTNTAIEPSETTLERLHKNVNTYNQLNNTNAQGYNLSFSQGVVGINTDNEMPIEDLINLADKLMYKNKKTRLTLAEAAAEPI